MTNHLIGGQCAPVHIWLDGVEQAMVCEANIDEGWIIRCVLDADGHITARDDVIVTEKVYGVVTAKLMEIDQ